MSIRRPWWRRASALAAGLLALAASAPAAAAPPAQPSVEPPTAVAGADERLVLMPTLNGVPGEDAVVIRRRGPALWISAHDLRALGVAHAGSGDVALAEVRGLRWSIDEAAQTIDLTLASAAATRLGLAAAAGPPVPMTPAGWGAILGYDTSVTHARGRTEGGAFVDASLYTPAGYGFAAALASAGGGRRSRLVRLETGFVVTDPTRLRRITVGDTITAATAFSRPVRLAGLQYGTDFALRPDLVTFPVPSVAGTAAVPSTVDLIVNGSRRAAGEVKAGQFAVADVPVQAGVNTITVAVRDALGRETLQTVSTYASRALLAPGLSAVSVEAGAVRVGYGSDHDRYGGVAGSASVRRGISDRLTLEAHAEADRTLGVAGGGATLGLGLLGQLDLSAAGSRSRRGTGVQLAAGFERIGGRASVSARWVRTTRGWQDLASRYGAVTRSHSLVLNVGFDLAQFGTLSAGVIDLGRGRRTADVPSLPFERVVATSLARSTFATASYSVRLARGFSLLATGGADLRRRRSAYATIGVLATFGGRTSAFAGSTLRSGAVGASAEIGRAAVAPGQVGLRAAASTGAIERVAGHVDYLSGYGRYAADVERTAGETAVRLGARGSLILTPARVFAADGAPSSVAIVETGGQPGVRVYRDNRPAGRTDRGGRLIVTNLNPFQATKISLDPEQLSDDFAVAQAAIVVRPPERSAVHVRFDLRRTAGLLVHLVDASGAPLPPGSRARTEGGAELPVGLDGAVFLESAGAANRLVVALPDGTRCTARFGGPGAAGVTVLGPVRCDVPQVAAL